MENSMRLFFNSKFWTSLTLIGLWFGSQQPAPADILYSTFAGTRAFDSHFNETGGSDGDVGQAFALAPPALVFGTLDAQLFSASANASANLVSGQLHVFADSDGPAASNANAHFSDVITIVPTLGFTTGFFATFTLSVEGTLTGNADAGGELQAGSTVDHADVGGRALCTAAPAVCSPLLSTPGGRLTQSLVATILVDPSNPIVFIQPFLFAAANDINGNFLFDESGRANFADTAQLSIDLPPGFTFTSNSGVLLTEAPQSTPEPATLPLMGAGLAALCTLAWRRRCFAIRPLP
jgi:PEP-CTERM motif-containing protein